MDKEMEVKGATPDPVDPQLEDAAKAGNVWTHEGKEYAKYIVNGTASVGATMMHPVDKTRKIAILGGDFMWDGDQIFVDHLNLAIRDERNVRDDESHRKRKNIDAQNAMLFRETVQRGWMIKIDEDGSQGMRVEKSRDQMLGYAPEIQSDIVNAWLGHFNVERYFPHGTDDIDSLLSEPESVLFACKVGAYKDPAHVFVLEFNTPSSEQRQAYDNDTMIAGTTTEGDTIIQNYMINNKAKLRFFRKHLRGVVGGVALAPDGIVDFDEKDIKEFGAGEADLKFFKKHFNPNWQVVLADALSNCFDFGGK